MKKLHNSKTVRKILQNNFLKIYLGKGLITKPAETAITFTKLLIAVKKQCDNCDSSKIKTLIEFFVVNKPFTHTVTVSEMLLNHFV